ncbi:MAG TPA: universal stress protein [Alphaproteobacteria bacterium]|nr:universal stress protein [Alphaproteobacteria bacterium]
MSVRVVLGLIDGGPAAEAAAGAALTVADAFEAHLQLLHVRPDPESLVPMIGEGMSGLMLDQMVEGFRAESLERAAAARKLFEALEARRAGQPGDGKATIAFREEEGREDEVAARVGRLHDLIVLARSDRKAGAPASVTLESVLLQSGRPVLVAPSAAAPSIGRKIVIAWNGKPQAARALGASLPFLAKADSVTVLTAVESHTVGRPGEVVRYLAWHGVRADSIEAPATGPGKVGQILLDQVGQAGADLLVMGAYGHSRLKEMILGGATHEVLGHAVLPVLMAH